MREIKVLGVQGCRLLGLVLLSQVLAANGMTARHDYFGIYASKASRQARDVAGEKLHLQV